MRLLDLDGLAMPALGFGTYPLRGEEAVAAVTRALELGYRHLDTAQLYGNEAEIGRAIRASGLPRDALFVTTKVAPAQCGPDMFLDSVDRSLEALGLAAVDLLLLHWPAPAFALETTLALLLEARASGRARRIGVSNVGAALLRRGQALAGGALVVDQVEWHPLIDQRALLAAARSLGVHLTAYAPLARGRVAEEPVVQAIAARHGVAPGQVALAWILQHGAAAIPMSRSETNQRANLAAADVVLDAAAMAALDTLQVRNLRVVTSPPPGAAFDWT